MESHFIEMFSTVSIIDALAVLIVLAALGRGLYKAVEKIHAYKTASEKREEMSIQHERDIQEIRSNMKTISTDLTQLSEQVGVITNTLTEMKSQTDNTEMIRYQDRLVSLYRHYKKIGCWNEVEKNSFDNMYNDYIARGGNSFVKDTIKPYMETLEIKTMAQVEEEFQDD